MSQMKEALDALFMSMEQDLKTVDASLKRHHQALKTQDKSLEKVYNLIATLERRVNHREEQAHIDELRIRDLESKNFVLQACHDDLSSKVDGMEAWINWLVPRRCRCVDRLDGILQADSEPSEEDNDDKDALTYVTDQLYHTPPQEEVAVLQPISVEEAPTCTCHWGQGLVCWASKLQVNCQNLLKNFNYNLLSHSFKEYYFSLPNSLITVY